MQHEFELGRHTILCVEPDAEAADLYRALLGQQYELTVAATGFEALRESNRASFDAYVLEHWLPDWTGLSFCHELRESDPHVPLIFCTASARPADRDRAIRAGASAYLVKPFDPQVLLSKLSALLALASAENVRARAAAQRAIQVELERRVKACREGLATALGGAEGAARKKALAAFVQCGGSRAQFDRIWSELIIEGQTATGFSAVDAELAYTPKRHGLLTGRNPAGSANNGRRGEA